MKLLFLILMFPVLSFSQQADLKWVGKVAEDTIPVPGNRMLFYQSCLKECDSLMWNSKATFLNCELKNVGLASYALTFRDTVLTETEIRVKGRKEQQNLACYYSKLLHVNVIPVTFGKTIWSETFTANGKKICAVYTSVNRRKAKMTLSVSN